MEANVMIQMALLAVLPLVMQGLKKIIWVENNKAWVCPLLCIVVSTGAAYFLQLPNWLMIGIITGAACNKIYDWTKDIKNAAAMIFLLALLPLTAGCNANSKTDFVNTANLGTTAVNVCTIGVNTGVVDKPKAEIIEIVVRTFDNCMIGPQGWYYYLKDPNNAVPPDLIICATNAVIEIIVQAKEAGLDVPKALKTTDTDVDLAKSRLEIAVNRYYLAVDNAWLSGPDQ